MQEDQTEYAEHWFLHPEVCYGVINTGEDMATIAEKMFSKDGWESLLNRADENKKNGVRPGIFMRKIIRMKELFYKQSGSLIDEEYFDHIQR